MKKLDKFSVGLLALSGFLMIVISSCVACGSGPSHGWYVVNDIDTHILLLTVYDSDGNIKPSKNFDPVMDIEPCAIYDAQYKYQNAHSELQKHPETKLYIVIRRDGIDYNNLNEMVTNSIGYVDMNSDWLSAHHGVIRIPEDCTVNPELGEIYDLDEFVELYGPLNAQGWDEVWQRWQQSKLIPDAQL